MYKQFVILKYARTILRGKRGEHALHVYYYNYDDYYYFYYYVYYYYCCCHYYYYY